MKSLISTLHSFAIILDCLIGILTMLAEIQRNQKRIEHKLDLHAQTAKEWLDKHAA